LYSSTDRKRPSPAARSGGVAAALALALLCLLAAGAARADGGGSAVAGAFADLEPGGRGAALAGALAPLVDDPTAVHWNPARLVTVSRRGLTATHADLFGLDLVHHAALYCAFPRGRREVGWHEGRIEPRRGDVASCFGLGLQATWVDLAPEPEAYAEYDLSLAYAARGWGGIAYGVTAHGLLVRSDLTGVGARGFSCDLALNRAVRPSVEASLVLRSLLSSLSWDESGQEQLRPTAEAGLLVRPRPALALPATVTYDLEAAMLYEAAAGVEWQAIGRTLVLRGGLRWRDDGDEARLQGAAGAGVQWKEIGFDYGLAMGREELGETHRLSLHLAF
jgi:hypothetical protein